MNERGIMNTLELSGQKRSARGVLVALTMLGVLAACSEEDVVLPGKRENIRSDESVTADVSAVEAGNEARPISLPSQSNNSNWEQSSGSPSTRVDHAALTLPLSQIWSTDIGDGDSRRNRITAAPVVAGGRVFTLDAESQVTATTLAGERLWQTDIIPSSEKSGQATGGGLAFADGTLFVASGYSAVVALEAATGKTAWTQRLEGAASGTPTVFGGILYLTVSDEQGWALSADEGRQLWTLIASPDANNVLGAPAPAVSNDLAVFAFGSGELQAVFRRGGLRRWDASVSGQRLGTALGSVGDVTAGPVIVGSTVYAGNQAGRTVALDLNSGARKWTANEGAVGRIISAGGSVFLISDQNDLLRLNASNGELIWRADLPRFNSSRPSRQSSVVAHHGPVLAGGQLHIASDDGLIRSFDPVSGAMTGSVEIPGGATSAPVVAGGVLYVVSTKGKLHAFR